MGRKKLTKTQIESRASASHGGKFTLLTEPDGICAPIIAEHSCGYVWETKSINLIDRGCPKCRRSSAGATKNINAKNSYLEKLSNKHGGEFSFIPGEEYQRSNAPVGVIHSCGEQFRFTQASYLMTNGCPKCNAPTHEQRMARNKNKYLDRLEKAHPGEYELLSEYDGVQSLIRARHKRCGTIRNIYANDLVRTDCPECSRKRLIEAGNYRVSAGALEIGSVLKELGVEYDTEVWFRDCKDINMLPFDFGVKSNDKYIALIEYDGAQHFRKGWGGEKKLLTTQRHDAIKNTWCKEKNIPLLRIKYDQADISGTVRSFVGGL